MEAAATDWFSLLPDEVLLQIFCSLPLQTLLVLSVVCRRWAGISMDPSLPQWVLKLWNYMNVPLSGSCNSGKSSILGRLLVEIGAIDRVKDLQRRYNEEKSLFRYSFLGFYSYLVNTSKMERERGITIYTRKKSLLTWPRCMCTIIDSSGREEYRSPFYAACAMSNVGVLVVDAPAYKTMLMEAEPNELKGVLKYKHSLAASLRNDLLVFAGFQFKIVIILLNKIDLLSSEQEAQKIYDHLKEYSKKFLKTVSQDHLYFIPCSAEKNVNIVGREENLIWFKHQVSPPDEAAKALVSWYNGPTLFGALNKAVSEVMRRRATTIKRRQGAPLRICVDKVFEIQKGIGIVVGGVVVAGTLHQGEAIRILPLRYDRGDYVRATVKSIHVNYREVQEVAPGYAVSINLSILPSDQGGGTINSRTVRAALKRGMVIADTVNEYRTIPDPISCVDKFKAKVKIVSSPTEQIPVGMCPILHVHTASLPARIQKIKRKMDAKGKTLEAHPRFLKAGDVAVIVLVPSQPLVVEPRHVTFSEENEPTTGKGSETAKGKSKTQEKPLESPLGLFMLRDNHYLIGWGVIDRCNYSDRGYVLNN